MHDSMLVAGTTDASFTLVREAFEQVAADEPGLSAQLCIYHQGVPVVDLWTGDEMSADALTAAYSVSKGAAYLVIALLVQDGLVDPNAPVTTYWPELVAAKNSTLSVADLLGHRAGLIGVKGGFTPEEVADDELIAARLETQEPYWEPGSAHGYHALTNGALAGEIARRVTGSTLHELFEARVRAPFDLDFYLGLPEAEDHRYITVQPPLGDAPPAIPPPDSLLAIALNIHAPIPTNIYTFPNERFVREKGQSSGGGIGSARGIARMYAAAIGVDGREPLLNPETIEVITTPQQAGIDMVFGIESQFMLGFVDMYAGNPNAVARTFGHTGATGSLGFADPANALAYGYTRRRFRPEGTPVDENSTLIKAMLAAVKSV